MLIERLSGFGRDLHGEFVKYRCNAVMFCHTVRVIENGHDEETQKGRKISEHAENASSIRVLVGDARGPYAAPRRLYEPDAGNQSHGRKAEREGEDGAPRQFQGAFEVGHLPQFFRELNEGRKKNAPFVKPLF